MHIPWNFFLVLLGLLPIVKLGMSTPKSIASSFILLLASVRLTPNSLATSAATNFLPTPNSPALHKAHQSDRIAHG